MTEGTDEGPWSVLRLIRWSASYLEEKGVPASEARLDSEHLLAHTLDTGRLQLYLQFDRPLTPEELAGYKPLLLRRGRREPLQYILGRGAFRELDLRVDPRVLIPRPETEELVQAVLDWARKHTGTGGASRAPARATGVSAPLPWSVGDGVSGASEAAPGPGAAPPAPAFPPGERSLTALDIGTGSGCIAVSLALEGPFRRVVATDVSEGALELTGENAREAGVSGRVDVRRGPLFEPVAGETFDVVVSNPPYVATGEAAELEPEVRDHEPPDALFGGEDGTEILGPLVDGAGTHLVPGGLLALEVGLGQADGVVDRIRSTGAFEEARVLRDLAGRRRMVLAELRPG